MIYRGSVIEMVEGRAWVVIPTLTGTAPVGPLSAVPADLAAGDPVLVAALRGKYDDMVVFSRELEPDRALAAHTHNLADLDGTLGVDRLSGRLSFDQLPAFPEIGPNADLNNYLTDGIWHQSQNAETGAGTANYPTASAGLLEVKTSGTFIYQRYTVYNSGKEYTRAKYGSTWYGWREVPSRAELNTLLAAKSDTTHTHAYSALTGIPATFAPSAHTHTAAEISDASTIGRTVLKAADATAIRTAIGAGTSSLVLGTGGTNAMPGNKSFNYSEIVGTVPTSALPPLAVIDTTPVASQAAMLALPAQRGDIAIRTDINKTYILSTDSPGTLADWKEVLASGQVTSVAGKTGVVSLVKADVGLGSVDNTADSAKPVSGPQQTALNGKSDTAHVHAAATTTVAGFLSTADKTKLDNATDLPTASRLVIRDAAGRAQFANPAAAQDAATKAYVDTIQHAEYTKAAYAEGGAVAWGPGIMTRASSVSQNDSWCTHTVGDIFDLAAGRYTFWVTGGATSAIANNSFMQIKNTAETITYAEGEHTNGATWWVNAYVPVLVLPVATGVRVRFYNQGAAQTWTTTVRISRW